MLNELFAMGPAVQAAGIPLLCIFAYSVVAGFLNVVWNRLTNEDGFFPGVILWPFMLSMLALATPGYVTYRLLVKFFPRSAGDEEA